ISLTLVNPSILPVGLPCASCVWNTSLGRKLAGGGGTPACPPLNSSFSTKCSFVALFFFFHGPYGMFLSKPIRMFPLKVLLKLSTVEKTTETDREITLNQGCSKCGCWAIFSP
uniref:Uncharacterized protein n=1 Tax=Poecilia latipinna TaxID=48699 RepID=A0A3B3UWC3_9TELE